MPIKRRKLTEAQAHAIEEATYEVLDKLLRFRLAYDMTNHLVSKAMGNWSDTEDALYERYPIRGTGVIARREDLDSDDHRRFVAEDIPLEPSQIMQSLGEFPLDAAATSYVFTLLEDYGDRVVQITNKKFFLGKNKFASWHHKVHGDADIRKTAELMKMANGFAEPFRRARDEVSMGAVSKLIAFKRVRNAFAHEGDQSSDFRTLYYYALDLICEIYFMLMPSEGRIVQYPFADVSERFGVAEWEKRILRGEEDEC